MALCFQKIPILRKNKFSLQFICHLFTKPCETLGVNRYTCWLLLQVRHIHRKMECCGNSCGQDFSKEALKQRLTSQQYQVTQEKDTERPFTGKYYKHFEKGIYTCIVCNQDLFSSETKYDSKCGWPAFFDVVDSTHVTLKNDLSHISCNLLLLTMKTDMKRTEVSCSKCGAHLGHAFDDGPKPTGKRYCVNSAALNFQKSEETNVQDSSSNVVPES